MRISINLRLRPEETHTLDGILHAAGFENRTEYLTALIHATLYDDTGTQQFPGTISSWRYLRASKTSPPTATKCSPKQSPSLTR